MVQITATAMFLIVLLGMLVGLLLLSLLAAHKVNAK